MAGTAPVGAAAQSRSDWGKASTVGEVALVAVALGAPAVQEDWDGEKQAGMSLGSTLIVTQALKYSIPEERPDGSNRRSFPSGHTSMSFAAASTLHQRYGWRAGLPATMVATFVGVARVKARKHYWHDVAVGAAIGETAGILLTRPIDGNVRLWPWGDAHSGGLALHARF